MPHRCVFNPRYFHQWHHLLGGVHVLPGGLPPPQGVGGDASVAGGVHLQPPFLGQVQHLVEVCNTVGEHEEHLPLLLLRFHSIYSWVVGFFPSILDTLYYKGVLY